MPRKLSTLIRKGAKLRPQGQYGYFPSNERGEILSCAIGAALEASRIVVKPRDNILTTPRIQRRLTEMLGYDLWSSENEQSKKLDDEFSVYSWVVYQNDNQCRTREDIADDLKAFGL
jgi:hypothetical protein